MEQVHQAHVQQNVQPENIVLLEVHHVQIVEMENGVLKDQEVVVI